MNIEIEREDIIKEMKDNFKDDVEFLFELVDATTYSWGTYRDLTIKLIENLKSNDELCEIVDLINENEV